MSETEIAAEIVESRGRRSSDEVDAIIGEIRDQMVSRQWVAGPSHKALATKHEVSVSTIRLWATQASRVLAASAADPDAIAGQREVYAQDQERIATRAEAEARQPGADKARLWQVASNCYAKAAEARGLNNQRPTLVQTNILVAGQLNPDLLSTLQTVADETIDWAEQEEATIDQDGSSRRVEPRDLIVEYVGRVVERLRRR